MQGYNNAPPLPGEERLKSTETVSQINFQWSSGSILNSNLYEDVIVKFTGYIHTPSTGTYSFYAPADDGVKFILNGTEIISDWYDKGGGGTPSRYIDLEAGKDYEFTLWYYENGGGANVWLYWGTNTQPYSIVPSSAFGTTTTTTTYDQSLLTVLTEKQTLLASAQTTYDEAVVTQAAATTRLQTAQEAIPALEQAVVDLTPVEPPVVEPTPEPPVIEPETPVVKPPVETVEEPTAEPTPEVVPIVEPKKETPQTAVEQAQEQFTERAIENDTGVLPYTVADAVTEVQAEEVLAALSDPSVIANAIGEGIQEAAAFVGELFTEPGKAISAVLNNVSQAGLDMSDDQREKAQEVIVPVVIVSQIASMMVGRIK